MENSYKQWLFTTLLIILNVCFSALIIWNFLGEFSQKTDTFKQNKTTLEIYQIYQNIDLIGFIKCHEFNNFYLNNTNCGKTVCDCVQNTIDVFENHCFEFTENIVDSFSECYLVAKTLKDCSDIICRV